MQFSVTFPRVSLVLLHSSTSSFPSTPPATCRRGEEKSRGNKLQVLESTFELRRRARYGNQRNPVSRVATVMNSSDVGSQLARKEHYPDARCVARRRSGSARGYTRDAIEQEPLISLQVLLPGDFLIINGRYRPVSLLRLSPTPLSLSSSSCFMRRYSQFICTKKSLVVHGE